MRARLVASLAAVGALATAATAPGLAATKPHPAAKPPAPHVFVIVLENEGYSTTFSSAPNPPDPYLARTLPAHGALVPNYYGIGHESLDNYVAMISGQAPNPDTQGDCQLYTDFAGTGPLVPPGQAVGAG